MSNQLSTKLKQVHYDDTGDRMCPTHANKKGTRYRTYISKRLMHRTGSTDGGGACRLVSSRVPSHKRSPSF